MWLEKHHFTILERNWQTKFCEIDIIAESEDTRYFIEVKYRSSYEGAGLAAITPKKIQQIRFAAELYSARYETTKNLRLAAVGFGAGESLELIEIE